MLEGTVAELKKKKTEAALCLHPVKSSSTCARVILCSAHVFQGSLEIHHPDGEEVCSNS